MEDRSPILFWIGISMVALSWLAFSLRIYTRAVLMKTFGLDDSLMGLTIFFFTAYIGCQIAGIVYGTGKHLTDLAPANAKKALEFWWFCEVFYIPCVAFLKLSVGIFLHRVAERPLHLWILRFMMASTGLFGSIYFFLAIFQCKPIDAWWIRKHDLAYKDYGFCMNNLAVVATSFASAGLNSFADWTFGIIPIFIVKDLQMPAKQKRLVAGILSVASIACIATIVRMPFILKLAKDEDFLFETIDVAIWSNVEPGIGIVAACAATLRPLLTRFRRNSSSDGDSSGWFSRRKASRSRYYQSSKKRSSSDNSYALRNNLNLRPDYVGNYTEITAGDPDAEEGAHTAGSRSESTSEKKEPMITGKELKDLTWAMNSNTDHDAAAVRAGRRSTSLSTASISNGARRPHPTSRHSDRRDGRERSSAMEIQKSVEFTFIEEVEDAQQQAQGQARDRSTSVEHSKVAGRGDETGAKSMVTTDRTTAPRTRSSHRLSLGRSRSGSNGLSAHNHFGPSPPALPVPHSAHVSQSPGKVIGSDDLNAAVYHNRPMVTSPREREPRLREANSRRLGTPVAAATTTVPGTGAERGGSDDPRQRRHHPAGAVGDPFASWRS